MTTLNEVQEALAAPFEAAQVELKPGATTKDRTRALALAFVDKRAYEDRLDEVVGPQNWCVSYRPWGNTAVICTLTILGITREDVGDAEADDPNRATTAVAQAFKRACSGFGLGRYLYNLPIVWAEFDAQKKQIVNAQQVIHQIYMTAGLPASKRDVLVAELKRLREQESNPPTLKSAQVRSMSVDALQTEIEATRQRIQQAANGNGVKAEAAAS